MPVLAGGTPENRNNAGEVAPRGTTALAACRTWRKRDSTVLSVCSAYSAYSAYSARSGSATGSHIENLAYTSLCCVSGMREGSGADMGFLFTWCLSLITFLQLAKKVWGFS